jgi:hypothetical protein
VNAGERMSLDLLGVKDFGHRFDLYQWLHAFAPSLLVIGVCFSFS